TFAAFTADIKQDAVDTKDAFVAEAKQAVQTRVSDIVDEMKAKAAANPAAAIMIGAGLGWYLLRHPPITTALVGCGLFSLLRTPAMARPGAQTRDYVRSGQERLKEQAQEFAAEGKQAASVMAAKAGEKITATASDLFETAKDSATRL